MHQTQPKVLEEDLENQLQGPDELTVNHSVLLQWAYNFKTKQYASRLKHINPKDIEALE